MAGGRRGWGEETPRLGVAAGRGGKPRPGEHLARGPTRRARAFAQRGVKPGDFVAIGLPNSNTFFETTFAVWKCGATPTSLSWRLPRGEAAAVVGIPLPSLVVGGEAHWNAAHPLPPDFLPWGFLYGP